MSSKAEKAPPDRPDGMTVFFIMLAAVSAGGLWWLEGGAALGDALLSAGWLLAGIVPVIIVALFIGGYVQALVPNELVARWLGENGGAARYALATVAGAATPAGPFGAFPIVLALRQAGAPFDTCVVYLTAWATLGIHRIIIWELPFLGHEFVALRVLVSLPLPVLAGLTAATLLRREP